MTHNLTQSSDLISSRNPNIDKCEILYVDIGNTAIKIAGYDYNGDTYLSEVYYQSILHCEFDMMLVPMHRCAYISNNADTDYTQAFTNPQFAVARPHQNLRFAYDITQLGIDRYLALLAVYQVYTKVVIIDCGSAITIDILNSNIHTSSGIAPGYGRMLSTFTFSGNESMTEFEKGCATMIDSYILDTMRTYDQYPIIVTGGDALRVKQHIQQHITVADIEYKRNLVIDGLKFYFNTNAPNDNRHKSLA